MKWLAAIAVACLLAGILIGLTRRDGSDPEAVQLLRSAVVAPMKAEYTARATTFASYGDDFIHSKARVYNARGGQSRIEYRFGSLAGVIAGRTGKGVEWRFDPLHRRMIAGTRPTDSIPNSERDLDLLLNNYRATVKGHTTLAGRAVTEVLLQPKNGGGGSRSLWIDNGTGVILQSQERNAENKLVAATLFTRIEYGKTATPDQFLPIPPGTAPVKWHAEDDFASAMPKAKIEQILKVAVLEPDYIPAGFKQEGHYLYHCPGCSARAGVTRYVNGLNSLSVIQAPESCEQHVEKKKMVNFGLGKVVFVRRGPLFLWVMGELPRDELERVGKSIPAAAVARK